MEPVSGIFGSWLFSQLAERGKKKLTFLLLGSDFERELARASAVAIRRTADEVRPGGGEPAENLARVIDQVFGDPVLEMPEDATLLRAVREGIRRHLAKLADPDITGVDRSSAELLGVSAEDLSARLTRHFLREIMIRGARGGPLTPLADQLNHDQVSLRLADLDDKLGYLAAAPEAVTVARSLPGDVVFFTGRGTEARRLRRAAQRPASVHTGMRIIAIDGMAGAGKTAFAVHAAHQLASRFPDGQLFLDLHGHTPGQGPVMPHDALAALLLADGVAPQQIPKGTDARAGLWRARLSSRRLLLLLDDAASTDQVSPLLPGTGETLVLVTSRRRLIALPAGTVLPLGVLPAGEAARLLARRSGWSALKADDAAAMRIVQLCGFLPLAVSLVAAQLRHHPSWEPDHLADELASAADSLPMMAAENHSVAAALDLSYRKIPEDQQRMFWRLGLHPGTDIDLYAAAAADDSSLSAASALLNDLFSYHLIEEPERGRYAFHDLVRLYARALAAAAPAHERQAAIQRVLDYYLHTARTASRHLTRHYTPAGAPAVTIAPPTCVPELPTPAHGLAWLDAERFNLHAAARSAAAQGLPGHTIAITAATHGFLRSSGHWDQGISLQHIALEAARQTGDRRAEAAILTDLGALQRLTTRFAEATASLTRALELYRALVSPLGEANALKELGTVQYLASDYPAAITSLTQALTLYRQTADRLGEASALRDIAAAQAHTGNYEDAASNLTVALDLYRDLADPLGEADAIHYLGTVQRLTGNIVLAIASQQRALDLYRETGNRHGQAAALNELGAAQRVTGSYHEAITSQIQAIELFHEMGNRLGEGSALNDLGAAQQETHHYAAAIETHTRALQLFRAIPSPLGEASALTDLGSAERKTKDYVSAAASLTRAVTIFRDIRNKFGEASALIEMGSLALEYKTFLSAHDYFTQALKISDENGLRVQQARAHESIAACDLGDSRTEDAAGHLRRALNIYVEISSPRAQHVKKKLLEIAPDSSSGSV